MNLEHLLPNNKRVVVYWHDGYKVHAKYFSSINDAAPFIGRLNSLPIEQHMRLIMVREVKETDLKKYVPNRRTEE